jgi:hypothetical protein
MLWHLLSPVVPGNYVEPAPHRLELVSPFAVSFIPNVSLSSLHASVIHQRRSCEQPECHVASPRKPPRRRIRTRCFILFLFYF